MKTPFKSEPVQTVTPRAAGYTEPTAPKSNACYHCEVTGHNASECRFKDKTCHNCKKKRYIAKACWSKPKPTRTAKHRSKKVHQVSEESDLESEREDVWGVDSVEDHGERVPPISLCVQLDGKEVAMELDTGASVSLMSENVYHKLWPGRSLDSTTVSLQTYCLMGSPLPQESSRR